MPALNVKQFLCLPRLAKELVVSVAKMGQSSLSKYFGQKTLNNKQRNQLFAKQLNNKIKCPDLKTNFECYDIVVTSNTANLRRHMDYKDDHREFYNHCFIILLER